MSSPFDPKHSGDPTLINTHILSCQKDELSLAQKDKPKRGGFFGFLSKCWHFISTPRERISHVRDTFNNIISKAEGDTRKYDELVNLYANSTYFNERVIAQHNSSKAVSYFFIWNRVSPIETDGLERILQVALDSNLDQLHRAKTLDALPLFSQVAHLLKQTEALSRLEGISGVGLMRSRDTLAALYAQKTSDYKTQLDEFMSRVETAQHVTAEDKGLLEMLERRLLTIPFPDATRRRLTAMIQEYKAAQEAVKAFTEGNEGTTAQELLDNKFVSAEKKERIQNQVASRQAEGRVAEILDEASKLARIASDPAVNMQEVLKHQEGLLQLQRQLEELSGKVENSDTLLRANRLLNGLQNILGLYSSIQGRKESILHGKELELEPLKQWLKQTRLSIDQITSAPLDGVKQKVFNEIQKLDSCVEELLRVEAILQPLRPTLNKKMSDEMVAANARNMIAICEASSQRDHPVIQAHLDRAKVLSKSPNSHLVDLVKAMSQAPQEHRQMLSLAFFQKGESQSSFYSKVVALLDDRDVPQAERDALKSAFKAIFPQNIHDRAALLERCARLWQSEEPPVLEQAELDALDALAKDPHVPLPLSLQCELLREMHAQGFTPRQECEITLTPLIDLVVTKGARHYFNRYALERSLQDSPLHPTTRLPMTISDVETPPALVQLVTQWLLIEEMMRPTPTEPTSVEAIVNRAPDITKEIATLYTADSSGHITREHDPVRSLLTSWMRENSSPLNDEWTDFVALTHELTHSLVVDGYPAKFGEQKVDYLELLPDYLLRLDTLIKNLDALYLFINKRIPQDPNKMRFSHAIELLRYLVQQPELFTVPHFDETKRYIARLVSGTEGYSTSLLTELAKRGVTGPFENPPGAPVEELAPRVHQLYVTVQMRQETKKVGSLSTAESFHDYDAALLDFANRRIRGRHILEHILRRAGELLRVLGLYREHVHTLDNRLHLQHEVRLH